MVKPGVLLLLLAVAASQVDLYVSTNVTDSVETDISSCPISFYGRTFSRITVSFKPNSSVAVCFKNSSSETARDCLWVEDGGGSDTVNVVTRSFTTTGFTVYNHLPNIKSTSHCNVNLVFTRGNSYTMDWYVYNFGPQAALRLKSESGFTPATLVLNATVGNSSVGSWTWSNSQAYNFVYVDLSGCRVSGAAVAAGSQALDPNTCSNVTCNASAGVSTVSSCGPSEVCRGNNMCVPSPVVCTVTASTVIDFSNRVHSVPDRCAYTLMTPRGSSDFELVAVFRERRRKDVPLLDHLILKLRGAGVNMHLEQGGRVRVGDRTLTLSAAAQLVHGVELSKDQTGVTAKMLSPSMTVLFDGNTAHVVTGHTGAADGLCGNPTNSSQTTSLSAHKSSFSAAGCEIQHSDTGDSSINCSRSAEHCRLMRLPPFTACHEHIDPESYVSACTNTSCVYPPVDGLKCQFVEAYAKTCSLKEDITLGEWRPKAGCPAVPQALCQDRRCSDHEFCGEKFGGTCCFCRAIFASKYKPTNTLGEPTVCLQHSASVTLAGCLLEDKGIDFSALHLNDQSCKGRMDGRSHMVTFSYDGSNTCGTEVVMNNSHITCTNTIRLSNSSTGVITRQHQVHIDFSCVYRKPDIKSVSFRITDSSVVQQIVSAVWSYTLLMSAYTDPGRMYRVGPDAEIQLDQRVWLELKTEGLDGNVVAVVTDSCWATSQPSPGDSVRYDLVVNGCPNSADDTVKVEGNGLGTSNSFSFNMFRFSGKNAEIYLHCKLELCPKQGRSCAPRCSGGGAGRRRRSFRSEYADGNPAVITMAWKN